MLLSWWSRASEAEKTTKTIRRRQRRSCATLDVWGRRHLRYLPRSWLIDKLRLTYVSIQIHRLFSLRFWMFTIKELCYESIFHFEGASGETTHIWVRGHWLMRMLALEIIDWLTWNFAQGNIFIHLRLCSERIHISPFSINALPSVSCNINTSCYS